MTASEEERLVDFVRDLRRWNSGEGFVATWRTLDQLVPAPVATVPVRDVGLMPAA
ncbi:hypothetical protein [Streptomyces sp. NBC_01538]|uniref:hypothetical protein n=1 Tax=Streptomyces sp. NBC_01538 TaxID=2903897 RepID=UPI00386597C2